MSLKLPHANQPKRIYNLLKVGQDTEYFIRDLKTKQAVPIIGLVGGTKWQPKPVDELGDGFMVQEDNVMLEFNTPAAATREEFVANMLNMKQYLRELMGKKGFKLEIVPSMVFKPEQLAHPQAQEIGCEPDFDVWNRKVNQSPKENPLMQTARCAGGHIHVSFTINDKPLEEENMLLREPLVKAMDLTLKLPSLVMDKDTIRPQLYGRAGAFRPKNYGIEYRGLSNFWTRSDKLVGWAFDGVTEAITQVNAGSGFVNEFGHHIQKAINTNDIGLARELLKMANLNHRVEAAA